MASTQLQVFYEITKVGEENFVQILFLIIPLTLDMLYTLIIYTVLPYKFPVSVHYPYTVATVHSVQCTL